MFSPRVGYSTKTLDLFYKINDFTCFMGHLDLWGEVTSRGFLKTISNNCFYVLLFNLINIFAYALILLEFSAVLNLDQLNGKQISDWLMFSLTHPLIYSFYLSVLYYKPKVKGLVQCLTVLLKNVYNDEKVEKRMIKRAKVYMAAYLLLCCLTLALYGFNSFIQVLRQDKTFVTLVTAWPDIDDTRNIASAARIAYYIVWWIIIFRSANGYLLAIASTICLSHQFKTLHSYFNSLGDIFQNQDLTQIEKEERYEKAFKVGIKLHSDTLWCTRQCQIVYGLGYSSQVMVNLTGLTILMVQMVNSERTILNVSAILATATTILLVTGIFMWNAGDVTVEASKVATAMYFSGWENCEGKSSIRIRKLLVTAMTQAQKPVIIRGFGGIIELSYGSFLSIVKSSYSVFSVVY